MKALVIGGTRFIGAHVVQALHAAGAQVTVFHRGQTQHPSLPKVTHITDPCAEYPITCFPAALSTDWDVVIHMVAMGAADAQAAVACFAGRTGRLVMASSGDVYRAYGRLTRREPGPIEPVPLTEASPLRDTHYPYRGFEQRLGAWARDYDKILAEQAIQAIGADNWTILRLPKVYGQEDNGDLQTIYGFAAEPDWRWTHGHVANVAAAIALAATHPKAGGAIYNVGEAHTPTMGERLALLPEPSADRPSPPPFDFRQQFAVDTTRIRAEIGYVDIVNERDAMAELAVRIPANVARS